jgi:hypothetical protein
MPTTTKAWFTNYYIHCGIWWDDDWDCMCNDECSICHGEIEPCMSIDSRGDATFHVSQEGWTPEGGWPPDVQCLGDLL